MMTKFKIIYHLEATAQNPLHHWTQMIFSLKWIKLCTRALYTNSNLVSPTTLCLAMCRCPRTHSDTSKIKHKSSKVNPQQPSDAVSFKKCQPIKLTKIATSRKDPVSAKMNQKIHYGTSCSKLNSTIHMKRIVKNSEFKIGPKHVLTQTNHGKNHPGLRVDKAPNEAIVCLSLTRK